MNVNKNKKIVYWHCPCGKENNNHSEICVKCGKERTLNCEITKISLC